MSTYELVTLDDGTEARRYEHGLCVPNGRGGWQFAERPKGAAEVFNSETGSSNALRRHELAREEAAAGLQRGVDEGMSLQTASAENAWGHVIEAQTELAIAPEKGHASTQAAKLVGTATGMMGDRASAPTVAIQVNISDDIAARYLGDDDEWQEA